MSECRVLEWSSAMIEPAPLDRREPGVSDWFLSNIQKDIDCDAAGVTIVTAVPSIRTEDDDGDLAFGVVTTTGTTFRVPYTHTDTGREPMYAIRVRVTTSDSRTLDYWYTLPIMLDKGLVCVALAAVIAVGWALAWSAGSLAGEALAQDRIADHCLTFKAALFYDGRAVECRPIDTVQVLPGT